MFQSLILHIGHKWLEQEATKAVQEKQIYMEENCPVLSLPGSMLELQVHSIWRKSSGFLGAHIISVHYLLRLYIICNCHILLVCKVILSQHIFTFFSRICARSYIIRLMLLMRRDMTWKTKSPRPTRRCSLFHPFT